jgi:cysteinyl-tRNA synthetase
MKKNTVIAFIFILLLSACKNNALNFNDELVKVHESIQNNLKNFYAKADIDGFAESDSSITITEKSINFIDTKMKDLEKLKVPKGGEEMMRLAKELYSTQSSQLKYFKQLYAKTTSDAEKITIADKVQGLDTDIETLNNRLQESQRKFAKDNNYKIK